MKKLLHLVFFRVLPCLLFFVLLSLRLEAQNGAAINTTGNPADPSAMLDVSATDKGVLVPRVVLVSTVDPIAGSKPAGLLVWNTNTTGTYAVPGFYFWNGTDWQSLVQGDNLGNHTATQDLNMSNNQVTSVGDPTSAQDAVNARTIQSGALIFGAATGTDNYSVSLNPAITTYATGMVINFIVTNANTSAVTINVNGLGTKSVLKNGNLALAANDIKTGQIVSVIYDGTAFQMVSQTGNVPSGGGSGTADPTLIYTTDGF